MAKINIFKIRTLYALPKKASNINQTFYKIEDRYILIVIDLFMFVNKRY